MFFLNRFFLPLQLCFALCWLVGCAGYHLGPPAGQVSGGSSIEVVRFKNETLEPRLSEYLMGPLRRSIQQDGTYWLCTERDSSDYVLDGVITNFERRGIGSYPSEVTVRVDEYIIISVKISLRERATGKIILEQDFSGSTTLPLGADQTSAERQHIPVAMENLARDIASILGDGKIKD
ncbi:MAG: hypothetical protein EOM12_07300 [Verrucomicrobiae bacterium]|nr:hypothetical protein [Verrucomicrobiae bacterium]